MLKCRKTYPYAGTICAAQKIVRLVGCQALMNE